MSNVPAHLQPYVDVLGEADAIEFLLAFGGAPLYLATNPTQGSRIAELVGRTKAAALAARIGRGHVKVPTAKPWIAQRLNARGEAAYEIARRLHTTDTTVRRYLKSADTDQLSLF